MLGAATKVKTRLLIAKETNKDTHLGELRWVLCTHGLIWWH